VNSDPKVAIAGIVALKLKPKPLRIGHGLLGQNEIIGLEPIDAPCLMSKIHITQFWMGVQSHQFPEKRIKFLDQKVS
jgi:hypothetical protein